jgi:hypothetical protein
MSTTVNPLLILDQATGQFSVTEPELNPNPRNLQGRENQKIRSTTKREKFPMSIFYRFRHKKRRTVSTGKPLSRAVKSLDDFPSELLHFILSFYTNSFKGLICFACLSKTCKMISDYSLLWITCDLKFFAPKIYLQSLNVIPLGYTGTTANYLEQNTLLMYSPSYVQRLFSEFKSFPPVYIVDIQKPYELDNSPTGNNNNNNQWDPDLHDNNSIGSHHHFDDDSDFVTDFNNFETMSPSIQPTNPQNSSPYHQNDNNNSPTELRYELAHRIRNDFIPYVIEYQKLWHWHGKYRNYLENMVVFFHFLNRQYKWMLLFSMVLLSLSVYFLFDFELNNISYNNFIGFYLIFIDLGLVFLLLVGSAIAGCFEYFVYNYETLQIKFQYSHCISGFDTMILFLTGILVPMVLSYIKLIPLGNELPHLSWWSIVVVMWGLWNSSLLLCVNQISQLYDCWDIGFLVLIIYLINAVPATFLFLTLYYDDENTHSHNGIMDLGDCLLPLYPLFFLMSLFTCFRLVWMVVNWYQGCVKGYAIGYGFSSQRVSNAMVFLVSFLTNCCFVANSFSILVLCILSFEDEQDDDNKKVLGGIHFSPVVFILLFFISIHGGILGYSLEESMSY